MRTAPSVFLRALRVPGCSDPAKGYYARMTDQPIDPPQPPASAITTITWKPSGPLIVEGAVEIRDNSGHPVEIPPSKIPGQIKLCACGLSKTRPFCDGSHRR